MAGPTKHNLVVICGGRSSEHEVSVTSARSMLPHIDRERFDVTVVGISKVGEWMLLDEASKQLATGAIEAQSLARLLVDHNTSPGRGARLLFADDAQSPPLEVDVVFPLLHGPYGEDGSVQGLMQLANAPIVGCGIAASAAAMDKDMAKRLCKSADLPQLDYRVVRRNCFESRPKAVTLELEGLIGYPLFVKPARMGSSVGVSRAGNREDLVVALATAARYDSKIIVEAAADGYRELECAVLGNEHPVASVAGEIVTRDGFYDYAAKYGTHSSELVIPAHLSEACATQLHDLSLAAFRAIGGSGLARVDFFVSPDDESIFINEINTMPGFTPVSMYPKLWSASGKPYARLISELVDLALQRHEDEQRNAVEQ
jgi:D-alanine-D-alanine ligase